MRGVLRLPLRRHGRPPPPTFSRSSAALCPLGERSLGTPDPGATSMACVLDRRRRSHRGACGNDRELDHERSAPFRGAWVPDRSPLSGCSNCCSEGLVRSLGGASPDMRRRRRRIQADLGGVSELLPRGEGARRRCSHSRASARSRIPSYRARRVSAPCRDCRAAQGACGLGRVIRRKRAQTPRRPFQWRPRLATMASARCLRHARPSGCDRPGVRVARSS